MRGVSLTVNGTGYELELEPRELLVYVLRDRLGLTGTNVGCDTSSCGACTVLVDGVSAKSCSLARRPGRRCRGDHHRGARNERRAPSRAAGVPRPSRAPVRLLHAGDGDGGRLADRGRRCDERACYPRGPRGQPLPLHRLPQHRRRGRERGRRDGEGLMSATEERTAYVGAPVKRREDEPLLTGRGTFVDNMTPVGTAFMVVVRSPYAHARVGKIDSCRGPVVRRRPRGLLGGRSPGRLEGGDAVRVAGHRGHEEPAALPVDRRRALPGRRRGGRDRRVARPGEGRRGARRDRLGAARRDRRRRDGPRRRCRARPPRPRLERVLRVAPRHRRDGREARGRGRGRHAELLPAEAHPERDRAAGRACRSGSRRRLHPLLGHAGPAHPAGARGRDARPPRVEAARRRAGRRRRVRVEAGRVRGGAPRARARPAPEPPGEVGRGALGELRRDDPRPRRRHRVHAGGDEATGRSPTAARRSRRRWGRTSSS